MADRVRVEDDTVFDAMHRLVAEWVADGSIDGLRVDHVDGLADPGAYLRRLRTLAPHQWIAVEKILGEDEVLPPWPVEGTTGYETGALLTRLLTAAEGEAPLTTLYHRFAGALDTFDEIEEDARHEILEHWLAGDAKRVALALHRMCQDDLDLRDYSLRDASMLIASCRGRPVYRTTSRPRAPPTPTSPASPRCANGADAAAGHPRALIDLVAPVRDRRRRAQRARVRPPLPAALDRDGGQGGRGHRRLPRRALPRAERGRLRSASLQRDTGRVPRRDRTGAAPAPVRHARHQHPRLEARRGRPRPPQHAVRDSGPLGEAIERWGRRSDAWRVDGQPDRNLEYYLYQTMVGAWPLTRDRAHVQVEKAAREAKVFTDWLGPSAEYERAMHHFVDDLFDDAGFIAEVTAFVEALHPADWIKALSQQLLKLTIPGVPDIYQGSELCHRALVDPDNRRPVDYACRQSRLQARDRMTAAEVLERMDEALPKLWTTSRTLRLKARHPALADPTSACAPLDLRGPAAARAVGLLRGGEVAVVVPIRTWAPAWAGTQVRLPEGRWQHVLADTTMDGGAVDLEALFGAFPVALLERKP